MWYVDCAWPFGLVLIGVFNYYRGAYNDPTRDTYKAELVTFCYLFQGGRMALGATLLVLTGRWKTDTEIGRYIY